MSAKKTAKKTAPSTKSKTESAKTETKKKKDSPPSNVTPMPGKFTQFVDEHGPKLKEQGMKLLKDYGPEVARSALNEGAKRSKNPTVKKVLGWVRDIIPRA